MSTTHLWRLVSWSDQTEPPNSATWQNMNILLGSEQQLVASFLEKSHTNKNKRYWALLSKVPHLWVDITCGDIKGI